MSKNLASLGYVGILVLGCSGKIGLDGYNGSTGGRANNPNDSVGGSGSVGGASGGAALPGGKVIVDPSILDAFSAVGCPGSDSEFEVDPSAIEFVIDVSGSMLDLPQNSTGANKWDITKTALSSAILDFLPDNIGVGILMYPNMNTVPNSNDTLNPVVQLPVETCVKTSAMLPLAPLGALGSQQRTNVAQVLANAQAAGGTPTNDALQYAYDNGLLPGLARFPYYVPYMVLITDGQPTISHGCAGAGSNLHPSDWHPIVDYVSALFQSTPSVKTAVIGLPGSDSPTYTGIDGRWWMSMAARMGGTQITPDCQDSGPNYCHFDMTQSVDFGLDLKQAMQEIIRRATPCSFVIPSPNGAIPDPSRINVIYKENVVNGVAAQSWLIGEISDTTCANGTADGWYIDPTDAAGTRVVLCPTTCKAVQRDKYAVVFIRVGCAPLVSPPT